MANTAKTYLHTEAGEMLELDSIEHDFEDWFYVRPKGSNILYYVRSIDLYTNAIEFLRIAK